MLILDSRILKATAVEMLYKRALLGFHDGTARAAKYLDYCRAYHAVTGTLLCFTRDVGHHAGGWWKNPDYERCWHLSLSFCDPETEERAPKDARLTREWLDLFYGDNVRKLWCEPPYSPEGRAVDVWHYRLFCNEAWLPIIPRGEVYTREFTEAGWKSFSDVEWLKEKEIEKAIATA